MHYTSPSDCLNYRFKEWTRHDRSDLEFTLPAVPPPLPPTMVFGKIDPEDGERAIVCCITAQQLWKQYRLASPSRDLYQRLVATSHLFG